MEHEVDLYGIENSYDQVDMWVSLKVR